MPISKKIIRLLAISLLVLSVWGEPALRAQSVIREDILVLTDSLYQGRKCGSERMVELSGWVAERFGQIGLEKYEGRRFLNFELSSGGIGRNVIGVMPGTSGKYVVVTAYYDALGVKAGVMYPGADSNASGVAVMLDVARLLTGGGSASGTGTGLGTGMADGIGIGGRKYDGVIFVALDGHFDSYRGAECLLKSIPREKIRMVVNLDTLGDTSSPIDRARPRYLMALGGERYAKTFDRCTQAGRLQIYYEYYRSESFTRMFYRRLGDQTVFLNAGIRSIVFTSGISMDTNKPTDTADRLDYNALRYRSLCIARWVSLTRFRN